jgi:hypothetical protein
LARAGGCEGMKMKEGVREDAFGKIDLCQKIDEPL